MPDQPSTRELDRVYTQLDKIESKIDAYRDENKEQLSALTAKITEHEHRDAFEFEALRARIDANSKRMRATLIAALILSFAAGGIEADQLIQVLRNLKVIP